MNKATMNYPVLKKAVKFKTQVLIAGKISRRRSTMLLIVRYKGP